ncbi:ATP-binding protein [Sphingomonas sp. HMP9]|uniref:ATP-binding protein n=1 Tax=Sphingomonas sp. HMP9 TaxID=1517554 RepID=UPI0015970084|nr:ATP-binding protein [Sphingomonas sp. HMP9]
MTDEYIAIMERRVRRAERARANAEALLERHARDLDRSNRDLRQRETELLARLDLGNRHLLDAQRTAKIATIYRDRGNTFFMSSEFHRILGLSQDTAVSPAIVAAAIHPLDRARVAALEMKFYTGAAGADQRYEHRILRACDGELSWLRWTLRREVRPDGSFASISGTVQDITEQRRSERRARALSLISERRVRDLSRLTRELSEATARQREYASFLSAVLDTVPQGIAVFDGAMQLAAWNSRLAGLTEVSADKLHRGLPFDAFTQLHWSHDSMAQGDRLKRAAGRIVDQRFEQTLSDGRTVEVTVGSRDDGGMVKTYTDVSAYKVIEGDLRQQRTELALRVTELERLSEELRRSSTATETANRSKSQFLAMMSHDIRTPLNGVLGMMAMLAETGLDPAQQRQLALARQSGDLLRVLLDDIIEIVRAESGRIELTPEPMDLARAIPAIGDFWRAASDSAVTIEARVAPDVPRAVMLDHTRFRQLLDNLVSNAIKYTREGRVLIQVSSRASWLRVDVEDTGPGIDPALQKMLFTDFNRLRTMAVAATPGAGLGLAICRRLVEAMGGQIGIDSALGGGSRFWFELPLVIAHEREPVRVGSTIAAVRRPDGARPRILIAEDIEINRLVLAGMLDLLGCDHVAVVNGAEAVDAITRDAFDIVLMDVQMPVLDGVAATRQIRALPGAVGRVPIIGVTAHALHSERAALLEAGMTSCLSKPIEMALLAKWLQEALTDQPVSDATLIDTTTYQDLFSAFAPPRRAAILALAITDLEQLGEALAVAHAKGDADAARRAAHSLKGVAGNIGASAARTMADDWEAMSPATIRQTIADTVERARDLFGHVAVDQ